MNEHNKTGLQKLLHAPMQVHKPERMNLSFRGVRELEAVNRHSQPFPTVCRRWADKELATHSPVQHSQTGLFPNRLPPFGLFL